MHPLLSRNRLGFYLLSWIPLAVILVYVMAAGGTLSSLESSIIVIPLCVLYAFICLSAWYMAKSSFLIRESVLWLIVIHTVDVALVSCIMCGFGCAVVG